ncbi:response regulator transcription factor [Streptococcus dentasini]
MAKIYIADDDKNIRSLLETFLSDAGFDSASFETGDQLFVHFIEEPADIVILDVMMPGSSGFDVAQKIRERSDVPIILLTARDSDSDYIAGFDRGADDYFTKPFSPVKLVLRVKAILARQSQALASSLRTILSFGSLRLSLDERAAFCQDHAIKLTNTEFELLRILLASPLKTVSREELLEAVWGYTSDVETRVTDDTVKRLRKKLRQVECDVRIETIWGYGFKLVKDEQSL